MFYRDFIDFVVNGKTDGYKKPFRELVLLFFVILTIRYGIIILKALKTGENLLDFSEESDKMIWSAGFSFVVLYPLFEELIFRGFLDLRRSKWIIVPVGLAFLAGFITLIREDSALFFCLFLIILLIYAHLRIDAFRNALKSIVERHYHLLVILSAFIFAAVHITNYDNYSIGTFIALVPRLLSGMYLAYVVTKYNIWISCIMHAVNNLIPFLIVLISEAI